MSIAHTWFGWVIAARGQLEIARARRLRLGRARRTRSARARSPTLEREVRPPGALLFEGIAPPSAIFACSRLESILAALRRALRL
jgi:hypothetical protein